MFRERCAGLDRAASQPCSKLNDTRCRKTRLSALGVRSRTGSESHTETTTVCCPAPRSLEDPKNKKHLVNAGGGVVEEEGAHLPGSWLADCDTERREVRVL